MKRLMHLSIILLTVFGTNCVNAGLFDSDVDVNIDRAIVQIHHELEHARRVINQLLGEANSMAKERVKEIDILENKIVNKITKDIKEIEQDTSKDIDSKIERINSIIENVITEARTIEQKFYSDLAKAIQEAECAVDITLNEYLKDALGNVGKGIDTNTISINPPLLYSGEREEGYCYTFVGPCYAGGEISKKFRIKSPFSGTYDDIKEYLLDRLKNIRPDTPVDTLVITYSTLSELAKRATCFHPGVDKFMEDYVSFRDKFMQLQEFIQRQKHMEHKNYEKENKDDFNFVARDDL